jgi:ribosome biogenesis protein MAK21
MMQIKNHPLKSIQYLDSLLVIARKKGRRETTTSMDTLKDIFSIDLLPSNRKLRYFANQPWIASYTYHTQNNVQSPIPPTHAYASAPPADLMAMWLLEDGIKTRFAQFLEVLEDGLHDSMVHIKRARMVTVYELLVASPEAETTLLSMLVNKLGDSDRKIASKAQFLLNELLDKNPGMKIAVIKEVERVIFRPHVKQRAQYYSLIFLNEMLFTDGEYMLAQALIGIYFTLFTATITEAIPTIDDRAVSRKKFLQRNQKRLKSGAKGVKGDKVRKAAAKNQDEGLSKKLLGALLTGVTRALPFARAVPEGDDAAREAIDGVVMDHTATLFKLVNATLEDNLGHFAVAVQALALLHQVIPLHAELQSRFYQTLYKTLLSPGIGHNSKTMLYLNILFKTIKNDPVSARAQAFTKRLLQVAPVQGTPFLCASLFLISEVSKSQPAILEALKAVDTAMSDSKPDVAEVEDEDEDDEDAEPKAPRLEAVMRERTLHYDENEGDPLFARANLTALWEVMPLVSHYHPSVARFATQLVTGEPIAYAGNPLEGFTRMRFLDKFVQKSEKSADKLSKSALRHRPQAIVTLGGATEHEQQITTLRVTGKDFATMNESVVPETDKFFYQYFKEKRDREGDRVEEESEDEESFAERLMEEELLKMSGVNKRELEDMDVDDEEMDMSDDEELNQMLMRSKKRAAEDQPMPAKRAKLDDTVTFSHGSAFDSDDDDDEDDEAAAMREMGMGADSDDDDLDMDGLDMGMDSDDGEEAGGQDGDMFGDTFASADEFADLLENAGKSDTAMSDAHAELLSKYGYGSKHGKSQMKSKIKDVKRKVKK